VSWLLFKLTLEKYQLNSSLKYISLFAAAIVIILTPRTKILKGQSGDRIQVTAIWLKEAKNISLNNSNQKYRPKN